ncbi:MAG: RagB/SusD family nutrient uptake outer membrane protein [Rikenellaceae bacterium]|jgi:hypothetical protein|nr:RagB/SusD family nutrient uptake outer membrane protein [Rikenellaceae bacterium]
MKYLLKYIAVVALACSLANCSDYLNTSSPENSDDEFVTSTLAETRKVLSWAYANYRQGCLMGAYAFNDPVGSDTEYYPEQGSANNANARLKPQLLTVDAAAGAFNNLYSTIARTAKVAALIEAKAQYQSDVANGKATDWTQLHGEAVVLRALCYFDLIRHFGDVPYGHENTYVDEYELTSRFDIYDQIIASVQAVEPFMYYLGENGITAERMSRTYANALIGQAALYSAGYQTIRTDVDGLYGALQFTTKGSEEHKAVYARRADYQAYYQTAEEYFQAALDHLGTAQLITADTRSYADNPFQRHFQYLHDLEVSPESILEAGIMQGETASGSQTNEFGYAFGRPSNGGNGEAPPKVFAAIRVIPSFYYGEWEEGDKRRDVTAVVTGSDGKGNELLIPFNPGNMVNGGISINKWDPNRQNPPYTTKSRQMGINWELLRVADLMLMQAEVKAEQGKDAEAITLVNKIRERAFGNSDHNIGGLTGEALKDAVWRERKFELVGEGQIRWDMIRSGKFVERAIAVQTAMAEMMAGLKANGYYTFANGNTISNTVFTKKVYLKNPLTYDCADPGDPALFPGWRGQYDYSNTPAAGKVEGTEHNLAIKGLFDYIDPNGAEATALKADGYSAAPWGSVLVQYETIYKENILSGITSSTTPPIYYWPIPYETLSMSKGKIVNGYDLLQQ